MIFSVGTFIYVQMQYTNTWIVRHMVQYVQNWFSILEKELDMNMITIIVTCNCK